jgi:predicted MFS family arabinose efflux permease
MRQVKHWQDAVNAVLGAWLVVSPWLVGYSGDNTPTIHAVIVGALLLAAALGAILVPRAWEEWTELALGLWLIASPWVLGFSAQAQVMQTAVATGIVVAILALWTLATDKDYGGWLRGRQAQ